MKQIEVSKKNIKRIVWTDEDVLLKKGNIIRFKNENDFWNIDNVYEPSMNKGEIKHGWHVGGL
jgi:hypothetical protein